MNKRQKSRFSMLINVQQFMWRNRPALGAVIWSRAYAAICEAMNEVIARATAQWVAQALGLRLTQDEGSHTRRFADSEHAADRRGGAGDPVELSGDRSTRGEIGRASCR